MKFGGVRIHVAHTIDLIEQFRDHGVIVWSVIGGDAEQFLAEIKVHKCIHDIFSQIFTRVGTLEGMECQETVVESEFCINPVRSDIYTPVSQKSMYHVQIHSIALWKVDLYVT